MPHTSQQLHNTRYTIQLYVAARAAGSSWAWLRMPIPLFLSRVVDGADKVAGSVLLRRAIRRLVHCRSHGMVVEETRAEADGVTRAGQLPACRPEGQPSIEAVFSAQGVATGGGYLLGGGAYVPPASRRGGRRHQTPRHGCTRWRLLALHYGVSVSRDVVRRGRAG